MAAHIETHPMVTPDTYSSKLLQQHTRHNVQLQNDEEEAELWRGKTQAFRNLYSFLSQVIPYQDSDLEKLFTYLRHLALKLSKRKSGPGYQFDEEVELDYLPAAEDQRRLDQPGRRLC